MKRNLLFLFITLSLLLCCVGCGSGAQQTADSLSTNPKNGASSLSTNPKNGNEIFELCKLNGTVTEFSDSGCKLVPVVNDGDVACQAAPDYEDQQDQITVSYTDGCSFQIAHANLQTGEITYEDASVGDIKKQTELLISGEYDSNHTLLADRVFIYRTEG